jgi:hypothetical protein
MANRATGAFLLSAIGAAYQLTSPAVAFWADRNAYSFIYLSFISPFFLALIVFWSASHLLEDWKGRITWPSIIFGLGISSLSSIIILYATSNGGSGTSFPYNAFSVSAMSALIPGPLLIMIGGILGFFAVRQYSREHGHAVLGHA